MRADEGSTWVKSAKSGCYFPGAIFQPKGWFGKECLFNGVRYWLTLSRDFGGKVPRFMIFYTIALFGSGI
jgi:hypothetical protein